MNLNGIIVEWLKDKSEIDLNNPIELVDFRVVMPNKLYPRSDGQPVTFDGYPNYEWLTKVNSTPMPYDDRFEILLVKNYPSQISDETNQLIKVYTQSFGTERRPIEQIINSIRQEQRLANSSLFSECDKDTMNSLCLGYNAAKSKNVPPSEAQTNAYERNEDVQSKILLNDANATALIEAVTAGLTPDISSGWEKDHITPAYPFQ